MVNIWEPNGFRSLGAPELFFESAFHVQTDPQDEPNHTWVPNPGIINLSNTLAWLNVLLQISSPLKHTQKLDFFFQTAGFLHLTL